MTRSRSSRGRHRGRRGRPPENMRPGGDDNGQAQGEDMHSRGEPPDAAEPTARQGGAPQRAGRSSDPSRPQGQRGGGRPQQQHEQGGSGRNPRRRQPRRQSIVEVAGEIIKARAPLATGPRKMVKRSLEDLDGPEGPALGCPMLTRTRLELPTAGGFRAPRCSLGWAVHSEEEAMYCMMTPDLTQCWKANPARLDILLALLEERDTAAD